MPPRSGQLDEISEAIGRIGGQLDSLERYTHEREHGLNNLSQEVKALSGQITREVSRMEAKIQIQIDATNARVKILEDRSAQETGAKNLVVWVFQSPLVGWVVAAVMFFMTWWRGQGR